MTMSLPAEVLESIVSFVPRDDLWSLYRVSTHFSSAAAPTLYRRIVVPPEVDAGNKASFHLLFRTFIENASLASLVEDLLLVGDKPKEVLPSVIDALRRHLAQAKWDCGTTASDWDLGWARGSVDVVIPLLLSRLPNLQRLRRMTQ